MEHLKVRWIHDDPNSPVILMSELDDARYETRKVEIYGNGHMDFAGEDGQSGTTRLGEVAVPPAGEIAADPEFQIQPLSAGEFEDAWHLARSRAGC